MPGRAKHRKGKYAIQSKRGGQAVPQQPAAIENDKPVAKATAATTLPRAATQMLKPEADRYLYVTSELRTIGVLAIVMFIGLVVLARVLG